jgi:hypothetical protein
VPKSKKVVTKVRNGHLKSGHHQKWSPPKVVTKSGHQIRNWSPDQKMNIDQKNIQKKTILVKTRIQKGAL